MRLFTLSSDGLDRIRLKVGFTKVIKVETGLLSQKMTSAQQYALLHTSLQFSKEIR